MDIGKILDVLSPPFREPRREKPRDMSYIAPENPDLYTAITVGVTHAISALMLVIYTVIIGTAIGLSPGELRGFVSLEIVIMGLILSRMLNSRRIFMVGLSITIGAALMLIPELGEAVPAHLKPILMSPLMVGGFAAIGLNLLFRIGISEQAEIELSGAYAAQQATRFLEDQGANWGARRDVITRAGAALGEALEALQSAGMVDGPVTLCASFDEYKLTLALVYRGKAFALQEKQKVDLGALLDEEGDAGLDAAMSRMPSHLIRHLADKVRCAERTGQAELVMQFNH